MTSTLERGEGGTGKVDKEREARKVDCVKMRTRGGRGSKSLIILRMS